MNFFKTVFNICCGPSVFVELMKVPLWRALLHFFLLAFLLALAFSLLKGCGGNDEIRRACEAVFERTGGFRFDDRGLTTVRTPEKSMNMVLITSHGKQQLDYLPSGRLSEKEIGKWEKDVFSGMICLRNALVCWIRKEEGGDEFIVMSSFLDRDGNKPVVRQMDKEDLAEYIADKSVKDGKKVQLRKEFREGEYTEPSLLSGTIEFFMGIGYFLGTLLQYLFMSLLTVFFFAVMQLFRFGQTGKRLSFGGNFTVTLYAAVPALIAGAVLSLLNIPYLDFQNVFLIVFFIYDIMVYQKITRALNPPQNGPDSEE